MAFKRRTSGEKMRTSQASTGATGRAMRCALVAASVWRDFGEDEDDDGQDDGGEQHAKVAVKTQADDGAERGGGDIDEVVAEEDGADEAVGVFEQVAGAFGALVAFVREVFEFVAVERHHRGFRGRKKTPRKRGDD